MQEYFEGDQSTFSAQMIAIPDRPDKNQRSSSLHGAGGGGVSRRKHLFGGPRGQRKERTRVAAAAVAVSQNGFCGHGRTNGRTDDVRKANAVGMHVVRYG